LHSKLGLHRLEQGRIKDGLVSTAVNFAPVNHLADVEPILEQIAQQITEALP
jgi:hypothetical protein